MKTFDIHSRVRQNLENCPTYVIPSTDGSDEYRNKNKGNGYAKKYFGLKG